MILHCWDNSNAIPARGTEAGFNGKISGSGRGRLDHQTSWARSDGGLRLTNSCRIEQGCL